MKWTTDAPFFLVFFSFFWKVHCKCGKSLRIIFYGSFKRLCNNMTQLSENAAHEKHLLACLCSCRCLFFFFILFYFILFGTALTLFVSSTNLSFQRMAIQWRCENFCSNVLDRIVILLYYIYLKSLSFCRFRCTLIGCSILYAWLVPRSFSLVRSF